MATMTRRVVLIVEDDPHLQKAMSKHLVRMDFEVRVAPHYEAAVGHLTAGEPSLVCIDIELPTQSGYEVCEYIRGPMGLRRVPILVTSDSGFPENRARAEEAGANAFLKKPFSMREFGSCVSALIAEGHRGGPGGRQARS
jgi:DNA-binding response OmpR family regulator